MLNIHRTILIHVKSKHAIDSEQHIWNKHVIVIELVNIGKFVHHITITTKLNQLIVLHNSPRKTRNHACKHIHDHFFNVWLFQHKTLTESYNTSYRNSIYNESCLILKYINVYTYTRVYKHIRTHVYHFRTTKYTTFTHAINSYILNAHVATLCFERISIVLLSYICFAVSSIHLRLTNNISIVTILSH